MIVEDIKYRLIQNQLIHSDEKDLFDEAIEKICEYFNISYDSEEIASLIENYSNYNTFSPKDKLRILSGRKFGYRVIEMLLCYLSELPYEYSNFIQVLERTEEDEKGNEYEVLKLYVLNRESYANQNLNIVDVIKNPDKYKEFFSPDYEPYKILEKVEKELFPIRKKDD